MVSSLEVLKDFNYASYCPDATIANLQVVTFAVVMNKDRWASLPADGKKAIDDLSYDQAVWTAEYVDNHVKEALEWSKKKYNHQVFEFSEVDMKKVNELLAPMVDEYIKKMKDLPAEQIIKDIKALKAESMKKK